MQVAVAAQELFKKLKEQFPDNIAGWASGSSGNTPIIAILVKENNKDVTNTFPKIHEDYKVKYFTDL
jgi:hypothetical protein